MVFQSGGANEGGSDDRLPDVGVCTEYLVNAKVSVEMTHITSNSNGTNFSLRRDGNTSNYRRLRSVQRPQIHTSDPRTKHTCEAIYENNKDMTGCLWSLYVGGMVVKWSIKYIANVFPCPWAKFVIGDRDGDTTQSKVPSDAFLCEGVGGAHVRDVVYLGRDAKSPSPQDILVSSWLREEVGNDRHELLAGIARLVVVGEHDWAKASDGSARSHVGCERPPVCIASDALGTRARIGGVIGDPSFHGVL